MFPKTSTFTDWLEWFACDLYPKPIPLGQTRLGLSRVATNGYLAVVAPGDDPRINEERIEKITSDPLNPNGPGGVVPIAVRGHGGVRRVRASGESQV